MKYAVLLIVMLALAGCSTSGGLSAQIAGANIEIAKAKAVVKPVLDAEIPTPHGMMKIVVHSPTGGSGVVPMPEDQWARVAERAVGVLGTAAGIYLGGDAAIGLVSAAGSGIVKALSTQKDPVVVTQPSPVVVQPAEPIVVTQPDPIIVTRPEPVVIRPEVVEPPVYFVPQNTQVP